MKLSLPMPTVFSASIIAGKYSLFRHPLRLLTTARRLYFAQARRRSSILNADKSKRMRPGAGTSSFSSIQSAYAL